MAYQNEVCYGTYQSIPYVGTIIEDGRLHFRLKDKHFMVCEKTPMFMPLGYYEYNTDAQDFAAERKRKFPSREIEIVVVDK